MIDTDRKKMCKAPWQQMVIQVHGTVTPCCFWKDVPLGNLNEDSILTIWNNAKYQDLRRRHLEADYLGSGCEFCLTHKQCTWMSELHYDPRYLLEKEPYSKYGQNMERLKSELESKKIILESNPTRIQLVPSVKCNIRCTYCYQHIFREKELNSPTLYKDFSELLPFLDQVLASGGEPLFLPFWLKFIENFTTGTNPYLELAFNTNGTIFNQTIQKNLEKFGRLHIAVSLDAASSTLYEKIRSNTKYEQIIANLDNFTEITKNKHDSVTKITAAIMKDNIQDIANIVDFALARKIILGFGFVSGPSLPLAINSFNNPLEQIRGWKEFIELGKAKARERLADPNLRAIAQEILASLSHLESVIPWEFQPNNLAVQADLGLMVGPNLLLSPEEQAYVQFHPLEKPLSGRGSYYSPIKDGKISLHIKPGRYYAVLLGHDFTVMEELNDYFFTVTVDGQLRISKQRKGLLYDIARKIRSKLSIAEI